MESETLQVVLRATALTAAAVFAVRTWVLSNGEGRKHSRGDTAKRYAAVELGGTSIRVAIAEDRADNIVVRKTFLTTTPEKDLPMIKRFLKEQKPFISLGIASFGPIDPRKSSETYGYITSTPKKLWRNTDLVGSFRKDFDVPIGFDTDVNAPAMFEYMHARENGAEISSCAYITVGTGVGVGLVVNGKNVHGLLHPEAGHILCPPKAGDDFPGLDGWAIPQGVEAHTCSLALAKQSGVKFQELKDLPDNDPLWDTAAYYLAVLCVNLILIASPERIVIGGGVLNRTVLYPKIRSNIQRLLNGYIQVDAITTDKIDQYVVAPAFSGDAGLVGALSLALDASRSGADGQ